MRADYKPVMPTERPFVFLLFCLGVLGGALCLYVSQRHRPPPSYLPRAAVPGLLEACSTAGGAIEMTYTNDKFGDVAAVTCRASRYATP